MQKYIKNSSSTYEISKPDNLILNNKGKRLIGENIPEFLTKKKEDVRIFLFKKAFLSQIESKKAEFGFYDQLKYSNYTDE